MTRLALVLAAAVSIAACGGSQKAADTAASTPPPAPPPSDVDTALAVQSGLLAAPTKADSVLAANGLTAAGFDSLMYRIAADSAQRAQLAARR